MCALRWAWWIQCRGSLGSDLVLTASTPGGGGVNLSRSCSRGQNVKESQDLTLG